MGAPVVLVLCTGNSARSQMAEALLRGKAGDVFDVKSAGTDPASRVNPLAIESMREIGIDITAARPKDLSQFLGHVPVRHLITVCHDADGKCPSVWPGVASRVHWPIEDPAAFRGSESEALAKFREVRNELSERLDLWIGEHTAASR
jgi:arsenate reductase (thioredoxin)